MISIVLPTVDGRQHDLGRTMAAFGATTPDAQIIVERGHPTCGQAWQAGAERARGEYLLFGADDLEPHPGWWKPMVEAVKAGTLPCPVVLNPDGSLQSAGGFGFDPRDRMAPDWSPVEWTTVPFVSTFQWRWIGPMIPLHYCTDMWVSWRGQRAGWGTVLRTGSVFTHYNAGPGRGAGMDVHERNRRDRAAFLRYTRAALDEVPR